MINKIDYIKEIFKELNLEEIKYRDKDFEIELKKGSEKSINNIVQKIQEPLKENKKSNLHEVKCPIVGIFYKRPSPDEKNYVDIGSVVKKGDVLCVVEAMKMFNEVKSPVDGTVRKINFESENLVSVDDVLFEIEE